MDAITLLREVAVRPEFQQMNRSTVKGYLGELLLKKHLEDQGMHVRHLGNQSGYDLLATFGTEQFRIDVKMSLPKDEFRWGSEYWGWALRHESKKRKVSASHLVCIGCTTHLELASIFVIAADDVEKFPPGEGQFAKVLNGFVAPCGKTFNETVAGKDNRYIGSRSALKDGRVIQVPLKESLLEALRATASPTKKPRRRSSGVSKAED